MIDTHGHAYIHIYMIEILMRVDRMINICQFYKGNFTSSYFRYKRAADIWEHVYSSAAIYHATRVQYLQPSKLNSQSITVTFCYKQNIYINFRETIALETNKKKTSSASLINLLHRLAHSWWLTNNISPCTSGNLSNEVKTL